MPMIVSLVGMACTGMPVTCRLDVEVVEHKVLALVTGLSGCGVRVEQIRCEIIQVDPFAEPKDTRV